MSVHEIAKQAMREDEQPRRDREERDRQSQMKVEALEKKAQAKRDKSLLERAPLSEWFPGVEWKVHTHFGGGTVFEALPKAPNGEPDIRLLVIPQGRGLPKVIHVFWTPYERWLDEDGPSRKRGWTGPEVKSAADVGRQIQRWHDVQASMPAHLP